MKPEYLIIHHSLTKDSGTVSWGAIRKYHTETMGFNDIGYHYGIELVGEHYEVLKGRPDNATGAHCKELDMNRRSLGICLVGNFDSFHPPDRQTLKLAVLCRQLMARHSIPIDNILGHREVGLKAGYDWKKGQYKTCPGEYFGLENFRARLRHARERFPVDVEDRLAALEKRVHALENPSFLQPVTGVS